MRQRKSAKPRKYNTNSAGAVDVKQNARRMGADQDGEVGPLLHFRLEERVGRGAPTSVVCSVVGNGGESQR